MIKASLLVCAIMVGSLNLSAQISDFPDADFRKADSVAALYPHHALTDLAVLSNKLTSPLKKDEEKFRAIYRWVCNNISNDYTLFVKHKKQRDRLDAKSFEAWNRKFSTRAFRILVNEHRTICTGYARLVSELALFSGIECRVVDGYGRSGQSNNGGKGVVNHSWNAVRLDNKWYLCDPTWSSGVIDGATRQFVKKFDSVYFLLAPDMFIQNHYPVDPAFILVDDIYSLDDYLNKPLVYVEALRYSIRPTHPEKFKVTVERGEQVSFQVESSTHVNVNRLRLLNGRDETSARFRSYEGVITARHTFKAKGTFAVHVVVDGRLLISYEVVVR